MAYVSVGGSVLGQENVLGNTLGQQGAGMPNQVAQSPINPRAFSAPQTIAGIYGQANPGTFTRSVGQPAAPLADQPIPVPAAIQNESQITPNQGFNNI